jgi:hypothetical protein
MRFWWRELAGWFLILLSLYLFFVCYDMLLAGQVISAPPLSIVGIIIFRGGIHLLKVAVAARICWQAQEQLVDGPRRASGPPSSKPPAFRPIPLPRA